MSRQHRYARGEGLSSSLSTKTNTLFVVPPPVYSNSRVFSHGYPNANAYLRQGSTSTANRSRSHSTRAETDDSDAEDDEDDDDGRSSVTVTTSDGEGDEDEDEDRDGYSDAASITSTARARRRRRIRYSVRKAVQRATHREEHLQRIYDIMMLSIARRDTMRAYRTLRVLLLSHEWQPNELWRHAVQVATMVAVDDSAHISDERERTRLVASKRLEFLQSLLRKRAHALQIDLLLELIPELLILGREDQAAEEIDAVISTYPYRLEPLLHLYSAMLYMVLNARGMPDANAAQRPFILRGVKSSDRSRAYVPTNLLLLRHDGHSGATNTLQRAEEKFEMALTVGQIAAKRGRRDIKSASRSRSRSRSRSMSLSRASSRSRNAARSSASESEGGASATRRRKRRRKQTDTGDEDEGAHTDIDAKGPDGHASDRSAGAIEVENDYIRISNDAWARQMARAYLAVIGAQIEFQGLRREILKEERQPDGISTRYEEETSVSHDTDLSNASADDDESD